MSATGRAGEAGTTLIEALAVVAILGIVASIGFPVIQRSLATLSRRETEAVVTARLRQTRSDAMRADRIAVFAVSRDGRSYTAPGGGFVSAPTGVRLGSRTGPLIAFYGDGSSTGGEVRIGRGGREAVVRVSPATGAIAEDAE